MYFSSLSQQIFNKQLIWDRSIYNYQVIRWDLSIHYFYLFFLCLCLCLSNISYHWFFFLSLSFLYAFCLVCEKMREKEKKRKGRKWKKNSRALLFFMEPWNEWRFLFFWVLKNYQEFRILLLAHYLMINFVKLNLLHSREVIWMQELHSFIVVVTWIECSSYLCRGKMGEGWMIPVHLVHVWLCDIFYFLNCF
jgi:hypothetical protein